MIIKTADDHADGIATLEQLARHPGASAAIRKKIEIEIRCIKAGARGEAAAAYEIDRHFGDGTDFAVIHDLRIVVGEQVAQIDHLIVNRSLAAFLCETKNFSDGLGCNEHGEWVGFRNGKPFGIASPLHQGKRHCDILQSLLLQRHPWHPKRLGDLIGVKKQHFVLVSNSARISRPPKGSVPDIDRVTKIESFSERRRVFAEKMSTFESLVKHVSADALRGFAEGLAGCHVPAAPNWAGKFGLTPLDTAPVPVVTRTVARTETEAPKVSAAPAPGGATAVLEIVETDTDPQVAAGEGKTKLVCATCDAAVPFVVARFCWRSKNRFGGKIYCRECQASV